ncbi:YheC/YheD family protein [Alteribacillus sp. JSM 102045]|uniref:YheC/YheD family protein n=1 Tax=Alteribacillus sp. JSM 102045 TaxID=1562101 RepID=UPI0035C09F07
MIGIILSSRVIKHILAKEPHPTVQFYKKLARNNKVNLCFYTMKNVSLKSKTARGYVYSYAEDKLVKKKIPVPKVNVYRVGSYLRNENSIKKIKQLRKKDGIMFFHAVTNYERSKYKIYQYLASNKKTAPYLPETNMLSYLTVVKMLDRYNKLYIKPVRSSRGNNIYVIEQTKQGFTISHVANFKEKVVKIAKGELYEYFHKTFTTPKKFLVQQAIDSDKYKGKKFDFRISPQKNKYGSWQVTGMIARVANKCDNITNLDQGGRVKYKLKPLISNETRKNIKKASIQIAKTIEAKFPQVIDLGIDLAVDKQGNVYLIEANFRPYRRRINIRHNRIPFEHVVWYLKQQNASAASKKAKAE